MQKSFKDSVFLAQGSSLNCALVPFLILFFFPFPPPPFFFSFSFFPLVSLVVCELLDSCSKFKEQ